MDGREHHGQRSSILQVGKVMRSLWTEIALLAVAFMTLSFMAAVYLIPLGVVISSSGLCWVLVIENAVIGIYATWKVIRRSKHENDHESQCSGS